MLRRLRHPNIVQFVAVSVTEQRGILCMVRRLLHSGRAAGRLLPCLFPGACPQSLRGLRAMLCLLRPQCRSSCRGATWTPA